MFIKPDYTNPPVPYKVMVELSSFAPGKYAHNAYQNIAGYYKGIEFFADDTSFINVYFSKLHPDLKVFKVLIDWIQYVKDRKITITNINSIADSVYDYLYWDLGLIGIDKDLHKAYYTFLIKVFLVTILEDFLSDLTKLPCYSDYTWLKQDNAEGAEELEADRVYVVYE